MASGYDKQCFKVVRQSYVPDRHTLPCNHCLGFFSSKILYRHRKNCTKFIGGAQASGQAKMIFNKRVDNA